MSTRHLGFLLCKNCGTLCIFPLKSAKTYQNRAKNSKIARRSTIFRVFWRYFYAFTLRYASLSCLSIRVTYCFSLLSKEVGKTAPDGIRILLVTLCPNKKSCSRYRAWIRTLKWILFLTYNEKREIITLVAKINSQIHKSYGLTKEKNY